MHVLQTDTDVRSRRTWPFSPLNSFHNHLSSFLCPGREISTCEPKHQYQMEICVLKVGTLVQESWLMFGTEITLSTIKTWVYSSENAEHGGLGWSLKCLNPTLLYVLFTSLHYCHFQIGLTGMSARLEKQVLPTLIKMSFLPYAQVN